MNLLFCINSNFVWLWKRCMQSILLNGGAEHYQVFILHSDLTHQDTEEISDFLGDRGRVCFIPVSDDIFEGFPETRRYPRQIYYRIAAPSLLPKELDRILYLDVDLVVINSLVPFYHSDFEQAGFLACSHSQKWLDRVNQLRLGIEKDVPYLNSGVMLINLSEQSNPLALSRVKQYTSQYRHRLILPDQDIISSLYGTKILTLDPFRYNMTERLYLRHAPFERELDIDWVRNHSVIIHYCGRNKPWKPNYIGQLDVFYHEALAQMEASMRPGSSF